MKRALKIGMTLGLAASAIVIVSCEAIVSDTVPQFTCTGTSKDACPDGMYCNGSGCKACEPTDVCDHYDNDCDGIVDNGPLSDADGDGYSWCGQLDDTNHPTNVDCDDSDMDVHPKATEVCDGKDNNCDGKTDDGTDLCTTPNSVCFGGKCVTNPCDPDAGTGCSNTQHCDVITHQCVNNTTVGIGQACKATSECNVPLFCADASVVGANVLPPSATGMCTQDCCSSDDCPSSFVCYSAGSGGHFCVDPTKIGRTAVGTEAAGFSESTGTRCRSGLSQSGRCVDVCCSTADCTNGTTCSYGKLSGHDTYVCETGGGSGKDGDSCFSNGQCNDQICLGGFCFGSCCSSMGTACEAGWTCAYQKLNQSPDAIPLCSQQQLGSGGVGTACTSSNTCASNFCYDDVAKSQEYCSDTCCVDSDCGNAAFVCRPAPQQLRCVKK